MINDPNRGIDSAVKGDSVFGGQGPATIAVLTIAALYGFFWARGQFLVHHDPVAYVELAKSLASGQGYRFMGVPHTQYPPGMSAMLALVAPIWSAEPASAQMVVGGFACVSLAAIVLFAASRRSALVSLLGIVVVFSPMFFDLATRNMRSELPYLFASAAALALLGLTRRKILPSGVSFLLIPLLVVATVAIRTIGIALPLALGIAWVHRRVRRDPAEPMDRLLLAGAVGGLLFYASWWLWTNAQPSDSYADHLLFIDPHDRDRGVATMSYLLWRVPVRLLEEITHYGELLLNSTVWLKPIFSSPVTILLGGTTLLGVWRQLKSADPSVAWYVLGYVGILGLWPYDEPGRYIFPLLPFLLVMTYSGFEWLVHTLASDSDSGKLFGRRVAVASLLLFAVAVGEAFLSGPSKQNWAACVAWLGLAAVGVVLQRIDLSTPVVRRAAVGTAKVALLAYVVLGTVQIAGAARNNMRGEIPGYSLAMKTGVEWLTGNANPTDVVMAEFAPSVYVHTGLEVLSFPKTGDADVLVSALNTGPTIYLMVIDTPSPYYLPTERRRLEIMQDARPGLLELVHQFRDGEIYRVN